MTTESPLNWRFTHKLSDFIGENTLPLGHLFCDFVDYYDRHVILETFSRDWHRTEKYLKYKNYLEERKHDLLH